MRAVAFLLAASTLFAASTVHAEEESKNTWEIDGHVSYAVFGSQRPTGGIMLSLEARHVMPISEVFSLGIGADFGFFGFADTAHWIGFLGGATASIRAKPFDNGLLVGLGVAADFGRIPVCTDWGLCLRYIGFFPAVNPSVAYSTESHVGIGFACPIRYISTLAWTGAGVEPQAFARVFW
jgi:hypothetical protein